MHLIAFDLDGTLVNSEAFEDALYARAVHTVLGIDIDTHWSRYRHMTDSGILDELLDRSSPDADRSLVQAAVRRAFTELVADYVVGHNGLLPEIPGARAFVEGLMQRPRVRVAVATGGWEETALIKVRAIGLDPGRLPIASSSDAMSKVDIIRIAERRALPDGGALRKTYLGDSSYDREVSQHLGYDFIGIRGNVAHRPSYPDFSDAGSILDELGLSR